MKVTHIDGKLLDLPADSPKLAKITIQKTMPFMSSAELKATLQKCRELLTPTGRVTLAFFGREHSWCDQRENLQFYEVRDIWRLLRQNGLCPDGRAIESNKPHTTENGEYVANWHEITIEAKPNIPTFARAPAWTIDL
ncbi:MAG: hypothetical protein ACRYGK_02280 [Janthinobacterium lividum]